MLINDSSFNKRNNIIIGIKKEVDISKLSSVDWLVVSLKENLSLNFIKKYANYVEWSTIITNYPNLTEKFISDNKPKTKEDPMTRVGGNKKRKNSRRIDGKSMSKIVIPDLNPKIVEDCDHRNQQRCWEPTAEELYNNFLSDERNKKYREELDKLNSIQLLNDPSYYK